MRKQEPEFSKRPGKGLIHAALRWLLLIGVLILLIFAGMFLLHQTVRMPDASMYPTIEPGEVLLADGFFTRMFRPGRGDLVAFRSRYQSDLVYIRRIIGLPGETVHIANRRVYINGYELEEPEEYRDTVQGGTASRLITLGEDEYFVLCDNRENLSDSREASIGVIRKEELEERVLMRIWPLNRIGLL